MQISGKTGAVAILAVCAAFADSYPRQRGIDAQHYVLRVSVSDENDAITGETTVTMRFVSDGVREFALDLANGMTVDGVSSGGGNVTYTHQNDRLTISLPAAPKAGDLRDFTIRYHGTPADGLRAVKNKYGERCFSARTGRTWRGSGCR